jgi:hypothetical protein
VWLRILGQIRIFFGREGPELAGDEDRAETESGLRAIRPDEVLSTQQIKNPLERTRIRTLFATVAARVSSRGSLRLKAE